MGSSQVRLEKGGKENMDAQRQGRQVEHEKDLECHKDGKGKLGVSEAYLNKVIEMATKNGEDLRVVEEVFKEETQRCPLEQDPALDLTRDPLNNVEQGLSLSRDELSDEWEMAHGSKMATIVENMEVTRNEVLQEHTRTWM
ncbi:hypothetical protein SUGI_1073190 [Cryptomeria japonica]|nr:hypothetical protein SUGI_1073190 [Cryptomeria japonica]